jgi:hypothetical protein
MERMESKPGIHGKQISPDAGSHVATAPLLHAQYALYADGIFVHTGANLASGISRATMNTQQKIERIERIITPMPKTLIEEIDDFRFGNRLPSRSQAIRELIRRGLGMQRAPSS